MLLDSWPESRALRQGVPDEYWRCTEGTRRKSTSRHRPSAWPPDKTRKETADDGEDHRIHGVPAAGGGRRGADRRASSTGENSSMHLNDEAGRRAGCALHGLRHSVLPQLGLSGEEPDTGIQRSGLSKSLARRGSELALDEQFSGNHGPRLSRSLRGGLHAGRRTMNRWMIKHIEYQIAERAFQEGWVTPLRPNIADRQARCGDRFGTGRAGRRAAI